MAHVVCLGELLIDFVSLESGVSLEQAPAFQKAPGGAPANVAVGLAKLGHELEILTETRKLEAGAKQLLTFGPKLIVITLGGEGSFFHTDTAAGHVPGNALKAVDTTGAGDGFVAGLLSGLLAYSEPGEAYVFPGKAELEACCRVANAVGALATTKRGAIPALPTRRQVEDLLHRKKRT